MPLRLSISLITYTQVLLQQMEAIRLGELSGATSIDTVDSRIEEPYIVNEERKKEPVNQTDTPGSEADLQFDTYPAVY